MGLDQSFYTERPKKDKDGHLDLSEVNELIYFRKYHRLDLYISNLIGGVENGGVHPLNSKELGKIINFIMEDKSYWAWVEEEDTEELTLEFYEVVGKLTYYKSIGKKLYYCSDW